MAKKLKIRKGDRVKVITGRNRNAVGDVLRVLPREDRVVVSGVNIVKRHQRPQRGDTGGIVQREAPIHISTVALIDPKTDKPTKVGFKTLEDGRKVRFARASGEIIEGPADLAGPFNGALELGQRLSQSRAAADCMANQWFRFALGRMEAVDDACSLKAIRQGFEDSGRNVRDLIVSIVKSDAFRHVRSME